MWVLTSGAGTGANLRTLFVNHCGQRQPAYVYPRAESWLHKFLAEAPNVTLEINAEAVLHHMNWRNSLAFRSSSVNRKSLFSDTVTSRDGVLQSGRSKAIRTLCLYVGRKRKCKDRTRSTRSILWVLGKDCLGRQSSSTSKGTLHPARAELFLYLNLQHPGFFGNYKP
jgi:hypothetical protein